MSLSFAPAFQNTPISLTRPTFHYKLVSTSTKPVVSIITPFYNTSKIFLDTAHSVFNQSLQQWEWLIVNDGSDKLEALELLKGFRDCDKRVRVIDLEANRGLPGARNAGIKHAGGRYILLLDSDDLLEPLALEKMAWFLESFSEPSFCKGLTVGFGALQYLAQKGFEARRLFLHKNPITITAMFRRQIFTIVEGFDESFVDGLEDWEFWLRCADKGFWGKTIPEFLDWFRRRDNHSERWENWTNKGEKEIRKLLKNRYPKVFTSGPPLPAVSNSAPYETIEEELPFQNQLAKSGKRLLMIIPWMAMGGADKFNLDLVQLLKEQGYEITIATTLTGNYPWYWEFANLTPDVFILPNFLRTSDYPRFIHYLIQSRQIDVVLISNSELGYKLLPYLRSRLPTVAFVDYCHMEEEYWNNGGYPRLATAYQNILDLNIVSSKHLREWMTNRGANPSKVHICYTNVDTDLIKPDRSLKEGIHRELNIPKDHPLILYAGRICPQKQPRVFARVMHKLHEQGVKYTCLVAGDGEDKKWLERFLRRKRLTKSVRMLGRVSNDRVKELIKAADIFFLPSMMEGISLTIFEAMATAVAIVGADVGGQKELVTPDCGILIQRGTEKEEIEAYSAALERLLDSPLERTEMGKKARQRVKTHFQLEQMGQDMVSLFEQAQHLNQTASPTLDPGLCLEHTIQTIEYERVTKAANRLWKYNRIEALFQRLFHLFSTLLDQLWGHPLGRALRSIKDRLWVLGHKLKKSLYA